MWTEYVPNYFIYARLAKESDIVSVINNVENTSHTQFTHAFPSVG